LGNKDKYNMQDPCSALVYTRQDPVESMPSECSKIPNRNLLEYGVKSSFFIGKPVHQSNDCYVGVPSEDDGHILGFGETGTMKTSALVLPSTKTWTDRMIAVDVKCNNGEMVKYRNPKTSGHKVKIFNPTKKNSARYDPYSLLRNGGEDSLYQNAEELSLSLLPTPQHSKENPVWIKSAQSILTGAILYYYRNGYSFSDTMIRIQSKLGQELLDEIQQGNVVEAKMCISGLCDLKEEVLAGICMDIKRLIPLATDPQIRSVFSVEGDVDVIDWNDFNSSDNIYDVILQIPEDKIEQWEPMTTLMLNQLVRTLERRADKYSRGYCLDSLLIMLDEFPRLGKCDAIKSGLATLRSRGVKFALFVQNLAQLDERYGVSGRKEILGCCAYKILLGVTEPDEQEYFCRLIGKGRVASKCCDLGSDLYFLGLNLGFDTEGRWLLEPEQLGCLGDRAILIAPWGASPIIKAPIFDRDCRGRLLPPRRLSTEKP
jgi:type IV secretion system protein VirD4